MRLLGFIGPYSLRQLWIREIRFTHILQKHEKRVNKREVISKKRQFTYTKPSQIKIKGNNTHYIANVLYYFTSLTKNKLRKWTKGMSVKSLNGQLETTLNGKNVLKNLSVSKLVEKALERKEATLSSTGALRATTGRYTGRSPKDKFIVAEPSIMDDIAWGNVNRPIEEDKFNKLLDKVLTYLQDQKELYLFNGFAGADKASQLSIRVLNEYAWHNLFAHQLFIRPTEEELRNHQAEFTIISAPNFKADPEVDGTNSEAFILVSFEQKIVLIGGTEYAGEIKKSVFTIMNYLLPKKGIFSMHCSSNVGEDGDVALFFGLSGTGKTTLSADPNRRLIGDDEHGWSNNGVFNIEGGCYAKCINLSEEKEPEIFQAIQFGSVLENVVLDDDGVADYNDGTLTENTRTAYPLTSIKNSVLPSVAGQPTNVVFLTADASGVLPPISKLTKEQAMYHFLSGYTSKLAGTERGVTSPQATFSTCFGEPFLPLDASVYAEMLGEKIDKHNVNVYLVNTGWTGGAYGTGSRMKLSYTRTMVNAAISGELNGVDTQKEPYFGLAIPKSINGVPSDVLNPMETWENKEEYQAAAKELAVKFKENFKRFDKVALEIIRKGEPLV